MVGKVCGTGSYVPAHIMTNDDLSRIVDTNDEWIRERTGIGRLRKKRWSRAGSIRKRSI